MYSPFGAPVNFIYTGIALTGNTPADAATIMLPNTGCYYAQVGSATIANLASADDLGQVGVGYGIFTMPNGSGMLLNSFFPVSTLIQGEARVGTVTVSGAFLGTSVTVRQTNSMGSTGLVALSFSLIPLPKP
jgi:hypothetical protein